MKESKAYLGKYKPHAPIHIVGGGYTGLTIAYYLKKEKIPFKLFEKSSELGGKIKTTTNEYGLFEHAANAIYANDQVIEMLNDLKLDYQRAKPKLKKYILRDGALSSTPIKKRELLSIFLKLFKQTPDQTKDNLTVEDFFKPLIGDKLSSEVLASALTGIYAEHISNLHHRSIFRLPIKNSETYFSYFLRLKNSRTKSKERATSLNFTQGLGELIQALKVYIDQGNIIVNSEKRELDPDVNTIIATDASEAALLLEKKYVSLAKNLQQVTYNSLKLTHYFTKYKVAKLSGAFGMVFHPKENNNIVLGVLSNSAIFSKRTKTTGVYSYSFITRDSQNYQKELEQDLSKLKLSEIQEQMVAVTTIPWKRGIPKYNYKRFQAIQECHNILKDSSPGLIITGNYINGISLREILKNSKSLVDDIKKELRNERSK